MKQIKLFFGIAIIVLATGCSRIDHLGKPPGLTPLTSSPTQMAMMDPGLPADVERARRPIENASLWSGGRQSLLGDRRAIRRGDILTVVIEIDEKAEISNSSSRTRSGSEALGIPQLFGIPQRINGVLPTGATLDSAVSVTSTGSSTGNGTVRRKEKLKLRVAATIMDVLPNGVLSIAGSQEVRVNFEIRELLVSGFVRPADISRQNEITYDKIASARISYGGRGQITDVQQPRYGQQILDAILPF